MKQEFIDLVDATPHESRNLYQDYQIEEELQRIGYHYEIDPVFFQVVTGGKWNSYSCCMWEENFTLTQAQEKKLDKYAELMMLKPGQKIIDIGCGWGGPLVYLCEKYDVIGHGITISHEGLNFSKKRAESKKVDASFSFMHWKNLPELSQYDAVYTDEVIVHFHRLDKFFEKCYAILKEGGVMVNKELHFTHSRHKHASDRLSHHMNKIHGYTGNYLTLSDELQLLDGAGFNLSKLIDIPIEDYYKTISCWIVNLEENQRFLTSLTSAQHVRDFRIYLRGMLRIFRNNVFGCQIVSATKS